MMIKLLLIGTGGFIGSVLRYLLSGAAQTLSQSIAFPYGTLTVNILGCLCVGVLSELIENRGLLGPDVRAFMIIGILGGFTTFSAFGNETLNLLRDGQRAASGLNVAAHLALCLGAVWLGRMLAQAIWR